MGIKLGITGGIGSGKSVVSRLFEVLNIPVYISDDRAKKLTLTHPTIQQELSKLLGTDIYINGELNKPLLSSYLFANAENAIRINQIIHPVVKEDFKQWSAAHASFPIIGMESARSEERRVGKEC